MLLIWLLWIFNCLWGWIGAISKILFVWFHPWAFLALLLRDVAFPLEATYLINRLTDPSITDSPSLPLSNPLPHLQPYSSYRLAHSPWRLYYSFPRLQASCCYWGIALSRWICLCLGLVCSLVVLGRWILVVYRIRLYLPCWKHL